MFAYMFAHEAHHRGQVIVLAHQLGYRLPESAANGFGNGTVFGRNLGSLAVRGRRFENHADPTTQSLTLFTKIT
jgi:hypothetical protein